MAFSEIVAAFLIDANAMVLDTRAMLDIELEEFMNINNPLIAELFSNSIPVATSMVVTIKDLMQRLDAIVMSKEFVELDETTKALIKDTSTYILRMYNFLVDVKNEYREDIVDKLDEIRADYVAKKNAAKEELTKDKMKEVKQLEGEAQSTSPPKNTPLVAQ